MVDVKHRSAGNWKSIMAHNDDSITHVMHEWVTWILILFTMDGRCPIFSHFGWKIGNRNFRNKGICQISRINIWRIFYLYTFACRCQIYFDIHSNKMSVTLINHNMKSLCFQAFKISGFLFVRYSRSYLITLDFLDFLISYSNKANITSSDLRHGMQHQEVQNARQAK